MKTSKFKKKNTNIRSMNLPPQKLRFKFDKDILEMFIGYVFIEDKDVTKLCLSNLKKLIDITDMRGYELNQELWVRINLLKTALQGKLVDGIEKTSLLKEYCRRLNDENTDDVIKQIDSFKNLRRSELDLITQGIEVRLEYSFIMYYKDMLLDQFLRIDQGDFSSFKEITMKIKDGCTAILNDIRKIDHKSNKDVFSLKDDVFTQLVKDTVKEALDPSMALVTGIKMLNEMLSPGFMPGRLYVIMALTGVFKSAFLLYCAYWIKKYNHVIPRRKDHGAIPTVLLYLLENDISETIIRLFNLSTSTEDITKFEPDEVVAMMREKGELTLKAGEIDILIKRAPNNTVSPRTVYADIVTYEDDGREIICCIIDHLKRMASDYPANDDRTKLRDISNGLKDLAVYFKIPFITAQQLNRSGDTVVSSAQESGKSDLARFLGRSNIADAWDILENADWAGIANVEIEKLTKKRYLTLKEVKKRYRAMSDVTYFNHPFVEGSTIMLKDDINLDHSLSKLSLGGEDNIPKEIKPTHKIVSNNIDSVMFDLDDASGDLIKSY